MGSITASEPRQSTFSVTTHVRRAHLSILAALNFLDIHCLRGILSKCFYVAPSLNQMLPKYPRQSLPCGLSWPLRTYVGQMGPDSPRRNLGAKFLSNHIFYTVSKGSSCLNNNNNKDRWRTTFCKDRVQLVRLNCVIFNSHEGFFGGRNIGDRNIDQWYILKSGIYSQILKSYLRIELFRWQMKNNQAW